MWPILLLMSSQICLAVEINSPSSTIHQPNFHFPPNFATTTLSPFTEKTIYLPPESQTAIPYHPILTSNNLQYSYLPPTESKVPEKYPPSYTNYLKQNYEENMKKILRRESNKRDEEKEDDENSSRHTQNFNQSRNGDISVRPLPKSFTMESFQDRRDIKYPYFGSNQQQILNMNTPPVRRTVPQPQNVIATMTEHPVPDQYKMASQVSNQYAPYHQGYQGTTDEPIEILRLSNEMDIDGTFRYETLTGDQTHIMQQGHIENIGTDNEEQVIEGSYSYVGDNGQTYTVHYIADGNGFRATGDHLPVAPPMPEIIQRSVEYNIMEESKRPQSQQLQNYPDLDSDLVSKIQHNRAQQQQQLSSQFPSPTSSRNHFTGRQPEAFSRPFPGAAPPTNQNANVQSASTLAPAVASPPKDAQFSASKLQPQITFMASQGAHVPKQETTTPSISRSYGFPPPETQRFPNNFFLNRYLESNQIRQQQPNVEVENHGLPWDLQRKLREIQLQEEHNKAAEDAKKSISRSSTDVDDDVLINFEDLNPQQYENVYYSLINPKMNRDQNNLASIPSNHKTVYEPLKSPHIKSELQTQNEEKANYPIYQNQMFYHHNQIPPQSQNKPHQTYSIENYASDQSQNNYVSNLNPYNHFQGPPKKYHNLITQNDFLPQSQTVTASYDYDTAEARNDDYESENTNLDTSNYEPKKISTESNQPILSAEQVKPTQLPTEKAVEQFEYESENKNLESVQSSTTPILSEASKLYKSTTPVNLLAVNISEKKTPNPYSNISSQNGTASLSDTPTTEESMENLLKSNFFLKNMNNKKNSDKKTEHTKKEIERVQLKSYPKKEVKKDINNNQKSSNVNQEEISNKMDISQLINFVNMKNIFESSKIVPKPTNQRQESYVKNDEKELRKQDLSDSKERMDRDSYITNTNGNNQYEDTVFPKQIKGKVYKTLHRNNGNFIFDGNNLRTDLTPPKFKIITSQSTSNRKGLPPLGRAGPNMKSYLPPVYT